MMAPRTKDQEWVVFIKGELDQKKHLDDIPLPNIFMASSPLRGLNLQAFIPQVVTIGPFHSEIGPHHSNFPENAEAARYKVIAAKEMEKHKVMAALETARRFKSKNFCTVCTEFSKIIKYVREQYDSDLECTHDERLAYILALDAAFVVEVLRSTDEMQKKTCFSNYYTSRFPRPLRKSMIQDFMLLENQIPLFLLKKLIEMDMECDSEEAAEKMLGEMVGRVACDVLPFVLTTKDGSVPSVVASVGKRKHLLDCLYGMVTFKRSGKSSSSSSGSGSDWSEMEERPTHFPRAAELYNSGVRFRGTEGNIRAVRFDKKRAILYVPKIRVGDDTEKLFRNLIAYESHLVNNVEVLSYLRFMNNLVDTAEDVALLVGKGIIVQDIGSNEEVANMWNNLCINTMRVCTRESEAISLALLQHSKRRINALKAEFLRTYLSRPWLVVSLLSGAALLVMTLLITYYTIELYYKPGG